MASREHLTSSRTRGLLSVLVACSWAVIQVVGNVGSYVFQLLGQRCMEQ